MHATKGLKETFETFDKIFMTPEIVYPLYKNYQVSVHTHAHTSWQPF
jgi:hypothetical protein